MKFDTNSIVILRRSYYRNKMTEKLHSKLLSNYYTHIICIIYSFVNYIHKIIPSFRKLTLSNFNYCETKCKIFTFDERFQRNLPALFEVSQE